MFKAITAKLTQAFGKPEGPKTGQAQPAQEAPVQDPVDQASLGEAKTPTFRRTVCKHGPGTQYLDHEGFNEEMRAITAAHPKMARMIEVGKTVQGRVIEGMAVGHGPVGVTLSGLVHSCEWITGKPPVDACRTVLEERPDLLDKVTIYALPVSNADGYEVSRLAMPMQRGNVNNVDINRNMPAPNWGPMEGGVTREYDPEFGGHGPKPLSEPESQALAAHSDREGMKGWMDFHSYGEMFLTPENSRPEEYEPLMKDLHAATQSDWKEHTIQDFQPITGSIADFCESKGIIAVGVELGKSHKPMDEERERVEQEGHDIAMAFIEHMAKKAP